MKRKNQKKLSKTILICMVMFFFVFAGEVFASQTGWRPIYDRAMGWLNFIILVLVLVKLGKKPLKNFLKSEKEKLQDQITELEDQKKQSLEKVKQAEDMLAQSDTLLTELKQKIIRRGEKEKQKIIESARNESAIILNSAKQKVSSRILQAKEQFRSELVDSAIDIAMNKIKTEVNENDNLKLTEDYIYKIKSV